MRCFRKLKGQNGLILSRKACAEKEDEAVLGGGGAGRKCSDMKNCSALLAPSAQCRNEGGNIKLIENS